MKLESEWITGFVDGEGCFHVGVNAQPGMTTGYQVLPEFTVVQHERDVSLLHALRSHFACGVVRRNNGDRMAWRVRAIHQLADIIVPFFEKHPLKTSKRHDFEKFRRVVRAVTAGDHLTADGITEIRRIAGQMNRGRSR